MGIRIHLSWRNKKLRKLGNKKSLSVNLSLSSICNNGKYEEKKKGFIMGNFYYHYFPENTTICFTML